MNLDAFLTAYGRWVVEKRWTALGLVLLICSIAGVGLWSATREGVPVDFTPQAMFLEKGEEHDTVRRIEATFGREDNDLLAILVGRLHTEAGIEAIRGLHAVAEAHPEVRRVQSPVNTTVTDAEGGMLTPRVPLDELPPNASLQRLARDPVSKGLVVGERADAVAVRIRIDPAHDRIADLSPVVRDLEARLREVALPHGVTLHITGVPFVRTEVVDRMQTEQRTIFPVVGLIFGVVIWGLFRRFWVGMAPLVSTQITIVWVMSALLAGGAVLNILSILVPTLVLVIGVADGIHVVGRYREEIHRGLDKAAAMGETLRHMTGACFLTTFTTGAGFASLLVADTVVIRDFGVHSAIAMAITFLGIMIVLPTWLAFIPRERVGHPAAEAGASSRALEAISRLVRRRPGLVLACALALVGLAAFTGRDVRTNSSILEMYPPEHPTAEAIHAVESHLSGVIPAYFHIEGPEGSWKEPENLERILALERAFAEEPGVRWTGSVASFLETLHGKLTDEEGLPPSREAVAQELLLAEMSGELPLEGLVDETWSEGRIMGLLADTGGREVVKMKARLEARAEEILAGSGLEARLTGDGILASVGVNKLIGDLLGSVGLVFGIILVTLFVLLRDWRLALVAGIPNLVPLVFTLATLGIMGADIQTSNVVSFTVAIGLAVDDTIHFIVRFKQERNTGQPFAEAMRRTYHGAGHAIVLTSALLVLGFCILTTSDLTSTRHFGILSSVTMVAALLGDLFLLPSLLWLTLGRKEAA